MNKFTLLFIVSLLVGPGIAEESQDDSDKRKNVTAEVNLYKTLFENDKQPYEPSIRPALNPQDAVKVQFHAEILSIDGIDHGSQVLTAHLWLYQEWIDPLLAWKPDEHGGVQELNIPISKIWKPDITLWNVAAGEQKPTYDYLAVLHYNGKVVYVPHMKASVLCRLNMKRFPYDTQNCGFRFGSWTYYERQVNFTWISSNDSGKKIGTTHLVEHQEWDVTPVQGSRDLHQHMTHLFISIQFNIQLKRKPTYYTYLFATPSILLMFTIPSMFLLPTGSHEKFTLGVGILISQTMLLHMLNEFVPYAHSDIPILGVYYLCSLILVTLSLILTAIISRVWCESDRQRNVPKCCRTVIIGALGKLLCVGRDSYMPIDDSEPMTFRRLENMNSTDHHTFDSGERQDDRTKMFKTYARITSVAEWRQMAAILDRLFLILFTMLVFILTFMLSH